jgi:hypothetical protein
MLKEVGVTSMDTLDPNRTTYRARIRGTLESSRITFRAKVRSLLLTAGSRVSESNLVNLQRVLSYLELGRWCAHQPGGRRVQSLPSDRDVFALALANVHGSRPLYLEFGVYEGASMRWWSEHLTTPEARFIGFDSFKGLREAFGSWTPDTSQPVDPRHSTTRGCRSSKAGSTTPCRPSNHPSTIS